MTDDLNVCPNCGTMASSHVAWEQAVHTETGQEQTQEPNPQAQYQAQHTPQMQQQFINPQMQYQQMM